MSCQVILDNSRRSRAERWLEAGRDGRVPMDQAEAAAARLLELEDEDALAVEPGEAKGGGA